ncbi:porin [Oceanospirillaceae bacterium ASx5O]|nr:porin [Oceanospirillaceae bacterium ASx5O]
MRKTSAILLAAALPMAVQAANTEFTYGGFIKLDAIYSQYNDGPNDAAGRDYYVPNTTPVGGANDSASFDMHAKTSRFNFKTVTTLDNGEKVTAFVEMDFLSGGGNEIVSNSYNPRLRHAFFSYNNLTFGQTWSTFMNVGALPETVDFIGVSEGTVFARQSQVRYTMGNLQLSLENPENTVTTRTGSTDDAEMPDLIARYNIQSGDHSFSVAGIVRELADDDGAGNRESAMGFGANVAGVLKFGANDLKFSVTHGQVARYVGLAAAADSIIVSSDIEPTDVTAAFVAYRHFWNPKLRSTVAYSMLQADYDNDTVASALVEKSNSARINLMYSPVKEVTYGVEYSNAKLEQVDGTDGSMDRLQFTAKYSF